MQENNSLIAIIALILGAVALGVPTIIGLLFFIISAILAGVSLASKDSKNRILGGVVLAWDAIWLLFVILAAVAYF